MTTTRPTGRETGPSNHWRKGTGEWPDAFRQRKLAQKGTSLDRPDHAMIGHTHPPLFTQNTVVSEHTPRNNMPARDNDTSPTPSRPHWLTQSTVCSVPKCGGRGTSHHGHHSQLPIIRRGVITAQGSDHRTPFSSFLFARRRSEQVVTTAEPKECALMLVLFKRKLKPSTSTAAARQEAWSNKWTIWWGALRSYRKSNRSPKGTGIHVVCFDVANAHEKRISSTAPPRNFRSKPSSSYRMSADFACARIAGKEPRRPCSKLA